MTDAKLHSLTRSYVDETLELLGDRDPIVVLEETPVWIAHRTDHLAESVLQRPEGEGKWSLVQVFAHLADTEIVFGWRARLTLTESRPPITGFDENRWVTRFDYAGADPAEALHAFATMRRWNLRVWRAATPEDHTDCVGIHSERGEESFDRLIRMTAGHDLRHRRQVDRLLAAVT
jgi:uncharacterized damage-inducible protein DinB